MYSVEEDILNNEMFSLLLKSTFNTSLSSFKSSFTSKFTQQEPNITISGLKILV